MRALSIMEGKGRASGRVLIRLAWLGLCAIGLMWIARGAYIPVKAQLAQILLERAFDQSVASGRPTKPWGWADAMPVARITVPRLGVSEVILSGGSGQAMAFGPTELATGEASNVKMLAAHRDTHFAFIKRAKVGDIITLEPIAGRHVPYRVTGKQIVRWDQFALSRTFARPTLGLVTCYPLDATQHGPLRMVMWAQAINTERSLRIHARRSRE